MTNDIKRFLLIGKKVKIKANSYLFELRTDAIASTLTKDVDYKQYNYLESFHGMSDVDKEFEIFDSIDFFELDNVKLVKINHYGNEVWTSEFEFYFDEEK